MLLLLMLLLWLLMLLLWLLLLLCVWHVRGCARACTSLFGPFLLGVPLRFAFPLQVRPG